jgi:hypothetical protein
MNTDSNSNIRELEERLRLLREDAYRLELRERNAPSWTPWLFVTALLLVVGTYFLLSLYLSYNADGRWEPIERQSLQPVLVMLAFCAIAFFWVLCNHLVHARKHRQKWESLRQMHDQRIQEMLLELEEAREKHAAIAAVAR